MIFRLNRAWPLFREGLFERDTETLFPTLDELGVGFVAYSPLGRSSAGGTFHYQIWRPPPRAGLLMSLLMPRHICRLRGGSRYVAVTDALLKQGA